MPSLNHALQELRGEPSRAPLHVEKLDHAISVIESLYGSGTSRSTNQPKRIISAASRRKMARAQKARWAKDRNGSQPTARSAKRNGGGSWEAHHVGVSPREDRSGAAGAAGKSKGCEEEGGLEPPEPITRIVLHSYSSEEYPQLCCLWSMPSVTACAPVHSFEEPTFPASKGWLVRPPR